jgi:hypothetical protein
MAPFHGRLAVSAQDGTGRRLKGIDIWIDLEFSISWTREVQATLNLCCSGTQRSFHVFYFCFKVRCIYDEIPFSRRSKLYLVNSIIYNFALLSW